MGACWGPRGGWDVAPSWETTARMVGREGRSTRARGVMEESRNPTAAPRKGPFALSLKAEPRAERAAQGAALQGTGRSALPTRHAACPQPSGDFGEGSEET